MSHPQSDKHKIQTAVQRKVMMLCKLGIYILRVWDSLLFRVNLIGSQKQVPYDDFREGSRFFLKTLRPSLRKINLGLLALIIIT